MSACRKFTDLAPFPIEVAPPDLAPWERGNTGVPYFHRWSADQRGPNVLVTAIVHGNELCGAVALDALLRSGIRPRRGSVTVGFCNVEAFHQFNPDYPLLSRFVDEDMNRIWDPAVLDGNRDSVELRRAREIRPLLDAADYLLDLHSMLYPSRPLSLAGVLPKGRRFAEAIGVPEHIVLDAGHANGRRMRDYGHFNDPYKPQSAVLVECGQHWTRASVDMAHLALNRFLAAAGVTDPEPEYESGENNGLPRQHVVQVTDVITVSSADFAFCEPFIGMEIIERAGTVLATSGNRNITTPYDNCVLIMPSRRLGTGQTAVRLGRFIA